MPTIKGIKFTLEHRTNLSKSLMGKNKGKKRSLETRQKMSISHSGIKFSKTHKDNLRKATVKRISENGHPWVGKKHKLDWKAKVAGGKNTQMS